MEKMPARDSETGSVEIGGGGDESTRGEEEVTRKMDSYVNHGRAGI